MQTTLHFPSRRMLTEPTHPGRVPVPDEEDHGGLLGHHGQRMRVALVEDRDKNKPEGSYRLRPFISAEPLKTKRQSLYFGTDERGNGGAKSLGEDWRSKSGVIHYVDAVIDLPPSLEHVILTHPRLESLRRLVSNDTLQSISTVPHLTLFLPASEAFEKLSLLESTYLFGQFPQAAWIVSSFSAGTCPAVASAIALQSTRPLFELLDELPFPPLSAVLLPSKQMIRKAQSESWTQKSCRKIS